MALRTLTPLPKGLWKWFWMNGQILLPVQAQQIQTAINTIAQPEQHLFPFFQKIWWGSSTPWNQNLMKRDLKSWWNSIGRWQSVVIFFKRSSFLNPFTARRTFWTFVPPVSKACTEYSQFSIEGVFEKWPKNAKRVEDCISDGENMQEAGSMGWITTARYYLYLCHLAFINSGSNQRSRGRTQCYA